MDFKHNIHRAARSASVVDSKVLVAHSHTFGLADLLFGIIALNTVVLTFAQGMPVTALARVCLLIALLALSALSLSRKR